MTALAERMGWDLAGFEMGVSIDGDMLEWPPRDGEYHLSSAGAFEVMVGMDTIRLVRYDDETWRSELYARNEFFWHESPHKAVELAAIALLDA
jgi:hypothetical protein